MSPQDRDQINPADLKLLLQSHIWTDDSCRSIDLGTTGRIDITNLAGSFAWAAAVSGIDLPPGVEFQTATEAKDNLCQTLQNLLVEIQSNAIPPARKA